MILSFFGGREGGVPLRGRQRRERAEGGGVVRAWEGESSDFEFFWGGRGGPWSVATEARDGLAFGLGRNRG